MGAFLKLFPALQHEMRARARDSAGVCADSGLQCTLFMYMAKPQMQKRVNTFFYGYSKFCSRSYSYIFIYLFILLLRGGLAVSVYNKYTYIFTDQQRL